MLICVDLDGTLLDTVPANAASYRAALEELGFTVTDEYYAERCNGGHYTRFLPPLMGGAPSAADVERVHDRKKALYSDFLDAVRPNTALMEILKTMRAAGHDLACVTTGSKQNATEVLEHCLLLHISEPTRLRRISYAVFCLKKKNTSPSLPSHT